MNPSEAVYHTSYGVCSRVVMLLCDTLKYICANDCSALQINEGIGTSPAFTIDNYIPFGGKTHEKDRR